MQKDVVVSIPKSSRNLAELLENDPILTAMSLSGAGIDGGSEYLVLLVPLAHFTVKALVDLLKANWERAKNVKIEVDGMTITGASLSEISEFLEKHFQEQDVQE